MQREQKNAVDSQVRILSKEKKGVPVSCSPTRSTMMWFVAYLRASLRTHCGMVAENIIVCLDEGTDSSTLSTSSWKPMLSISSASSNTKKRVSERSSTLHANHTVSISSHIRYKYAVQVRGVKQAYIIFLKKHGVHLCRWMYANEELQKKVECMRNIPNGSTIPHGSGSVEAHCRFWTRSMVRPGVPTITSTPRSISRI